MPDRIEELDYTHPDVSSGAHSMIQEEWTDLEWLHSQERVDFYARGLDVELLELIWELGQPVSGDLFRSRLNGHASGKRAREKEGARAVVRAWREFRKGSAIGFTHRRCNFRLTSQFNTMALLLVDDT